MTPTSPTVCGLAWAVSRCQSRRPHRLYSSKLATPDGASVSPVGSRLGRSEREASPIPSRGPCAGGPRPQPLDGEGVAIAWSGSDGPEGRPAHPHEIRSSHQTPDFARARWRQENPYRKGEVESCANSSPHHRVRGTLRSPVLDSSAVKGHPKATLDVPNVTKNLVPHSVSHSTIPLRIRSAWLSRNRD